MIPAELQKLIDKFYAGETTDAEEQQLKAFFGQEEAPEELAMDSAFFKALNEASEEELSNSFDENLFNKIEDQQPVKKIKNWRYSLSGVAAAIAVFLVVWFGTDLLQTRQVYGTINDPHLAFSESQKAIQEVSKNIKKGIVPVKQTVEKVENNIQKTDEVKKINKALDKTRSLQKIDEASDLLKSFSKVYVNYGKS